MLKTHNLDYILHETAFKTRQLGLIIEILFSISKKFITNSNNIPSISKTKQHTPMTWCTYLQSFEKIHRCVFELHTVRKLNVTDRQADRRTGGVAISPVRAFGEAGDTYKHMPYPIPNVASTEIHHMTLLVPDTGGFYLCV